MFKRCALGFVLVAALSVPAAAQTYPTHAVRVIVPYAAGGGVDVVMRALAPELTSGWRQPVLIENRTGAGSLIGTEAVARSQPDGHTLLATTSQTFTANRYLYKTLPYDPDRSFVPITLMVKADQFLLANSTLPANNLKELVALARSRQTSLSYGSWGQGSEPQITYEQLNKREGLSLVHVPYKGVAPVIAALTGNEVQLTVGSAGVAGALIKSGRLKPLALAAQTRSTRFPDVPTTAELSYPYLRAAILIGLWAPAGTPAPALEKIGNDVRSLLKNPAFADKVTAMGYDVVASTPEGLTALMGGESARIQEVVQAANIKAE
jgi:tripartite-type tricarboxylate transporter receptor subunit TctC